MFVHKSPEASIPSLPAKRWDSSADRVAARGHTARKRALIVSHLRVMRLLGFLLGGGLLLLGLPPPHGSSRRTDSGPDGRSFTRVSTDRPADRSDGGATRGPLHGGV